MRHSMRKTKKTDRWLPQVTLPWMTETSDHPNEVSRRKKSARYCKQAAEVICTKMLRDFGKDAKARIFCPETGEFVAFVLDPQTDEIRRYNGRETRD